MLRSLKLENYRCFNSFELNPLGRINLLVGENNSGKTSILEALYLLKSTANLDSLREFMTGRGEYSFSSDTIQPPLAYNLKIQHLFYGHKMGSSNQISIMARNQRDGHQMGDNDQESCSLYPDLQKDVLIVNWTGNRPQTITLQLSDQGTLNTNHIRTSRQASETQNYENYDRVLFLNSRSLTSNQLIELFQQVVLTPEEALVVEALKIIEPNLERIASIGAGHKIAYNGISNDFMVRLSNSDQRIPLGSLGDGMRRMLALTLEMVNAKDGVLLVDEIDTGLHFSAMTDMWRLIWKTAQDLNVQVFATTHSRDCWTSLAEVAYQEQVGEEDITIHRIEKGKSKSVVFTEPEIVIAAERNIEVR